MKIIEQHVSPDGLLKFVVGQEDDGDIYLGFDNGWHTHADILAASSGLPEDEAVRQFVDQLLNDQKIIAVVRIDGDDVPCVWITDNPAEDMKNKRSSDVMEFRYWSGNHCSI